MRIYTIGVYGYTPETFHGALAAADVQVLYDIRYRSAVRGSKYSFANRNRLEASVPLIGAQYTQLKELAPPPELREKLKAEETSLKIAKKTREGLPDWWIDSYKKERLEPFDFKAFIEVHDASALNIALMCVEQFPHQCHRSVAAEYMGKNFGMEVVHLTP